MEILRFCWKFPAEEKPNSSREGGTQTRFLYNHLQFRKSGIFIRPVYADRKSHSWLIFIALFALCEFALLFKRHRNLSPEIQNIGKNISRGGL